MSKKKNAAAARSPIQMIDREADRLTELALQKQHDLPRHYQLLLDEIDRANICSAANIRPNVVTMGSKVTFTDEKTGNQRTVELVYPGEANIDAGRISILWPDQRGAEHQLTIVEVEQPAQ